MSKKKPLTADVHSILASRSSWWDRLPPEAQDELLAFRQAFQSGEYGPAKAWSVASALTKAVAGRGWKLCSEKQLASWLSKRS